MTLRAAYVADTTADVRMLEGLGARMDLTLVAPSSLGDRLSTGQIGERVRVVLIDGSVAAFNLRASAWLRAHAAELDVIFALDNLRAAAAANWAARRSGLPVILQQGRPTEEYFRAKRRAGVIKGSRYVAGLAALKTLVWWNERSAAAVGAISEHVAAPSLRRAKRVVLIPWYGVDVDAFRPSPSQDEARAALGLPAGPLVLFRSRIAPEKDPGTFLAALSLLRARGRDVTALYVGAEYRDVEAMGRAAGVPVIGRDHVHPTRELPLYYRAASALVQTSHREGLGMSPLEAMACEVPCIVTATGGLVEVAAGGRCAMMVPPRDPEAVAAAIAHLLDHPQDAASLARRGRAHVLDRYAADATFDAWVTLAADLAANARNRVPVA